MRNPCTLWFQLGCCLSKQETGDRGSALDRNVWVGAGIKFECGSVGLELKSHPTLATLDKLAELYWLVFEYMRRILNTVYPIWHGGGAWAPSPQKQIPGCLRVSPMCHQFSLSLCIYLENFWIWNQNNLCIQSFKIQDFAILLKRFRISTGCQNSNIGHEHCQRITINSFSLMLWTLTIQFRWLIMYFRPIR